MKTKSFLLCAWIYSFIGVKMDPTDDMIMTLQVTVDELKKGITEYSNKMNTVDEASKGIYYEYINTNGR